MLTEKVVESAKTAGVISIMVDEARSFKEQQLSFCIRYVDAKLIPHERFLLFKDCSSGRNAEELSNSLVNILEQLALSDLSIVAQT